MITMAVKKVGYLEEQERIKNQTIEEWISEYSGEPVKEPEKASINNIDDNFGVEF